MTSPAQVLDYKADLADHLDSANYHDYMGGFTQDMVEKRSVITRPEATRRDVGKFWCDREARAVRVGEAYHIAASMTPVINWASLQLEGTDRFRRDFLPSDQGFAWFDDPLEVEDVWGVDYYVRALSWHIGTAQTQTGREWAGVWVTLYNDYNDPRDVLRQQTEKKIAAGETRTHVSEVLGRLQVYHYEFIPWEQRVGPVQQEIAESYQQFLRDHMQERLDRGYEGPEKEVRPTQRSTSRLLLAYWMLMGQTLTRVTEADLPRSTKRRMGRMKIPPRVTVVALRRMEGVARAEGESLVEWQHRWVVRGHWAWRHCSANHPLAEPYEKGYRARVYIAPFVKGPEDKPFVQSEKVYSLQR